ncbi:MAG TPA: membrane protein insertase YidC [Burkholderiaceae bacterium]|jgi:YidC/Oxa1 family membrane protein insertase
MDIQRTVLWVVFSMSILFLWDNWMRDHGHTSIFFPSAHQQTQTTTTGGAKSDLPQASSSATATTTPAAANVVANGTTPVKSEIITITTDVYKADIDTVGGELKRLELLKYKSEVNPTSNEVLFDVGPGHIYLAQTGLIGGAADAPLPNHKSGFVAKPGPRSLDGANEISLVLEAEQNGVKLTKTYTFKRGDYVIDVKHQVTNESGAPIKPSLYLQLLHDGNKPADDTRFRSSYTGPSVYTDAEKFQKLDFKKIEEGKEQHATKADSGWIAIVQHFFVSAFIPQDKTPREIYTKKVDTNEYAVGTILPLGTIAPGATASMDAKLYSGPQETSLLEKVAPGLDLVKDYGKLTIIAEPLFWVMDHIHKVLGNWGWTIIVFTILIKLAFFPLSAAGYRSMAKMKVVTPKMTAIRERYKSDPQKMNQAMMELYKTEKINPLGGCLPILIQMPVFIALYWVLQASVEIRNAPWIGWIHDLAAPDPLFILPIIYAISMYITTKLNPAPADPMQAKVMLFMPLAFSVMFFFFPSGLVLYWVVNNVLSIGQQWVITKKMGGMKPA